MLSILKRRRDTTRVIYELLSISKDGISKTQMVNRANLNFRLAKPYLAFLLDKGMLQINRNARGVSSLELTGKGKHFLGYLASVEQELSDLFPS